MNEQALLQYAVQIVKDLEDKIEGMKRCGICEHYDENHGEGFCSLEKDYLESFVCRDGTCDKWEMME